MVVIPGSPTLVDERPVFLAEHGRRRRYVRAAGRVTVALLLGAVAVVLAAVTGGATLPLLVQPDGVRAPAERVVERLGVPVPGLPRPEAAPAGSPGGSDTSPAPQPESAPMGNGAGWPAWTRWSPGAG